MAPTLASGLTLSATVLAFRALAGVTSKSFTVRGLPILQAALDGRGDSSDVKGKGKAIEVADDLQDLLPKLGRRGVVTVCNHNSVVDDPMTWAAMPISTYMPFATPSKVSRNSRWTLGARDIMFTNPFLNWFFANGQVLNTERGAGIFQPAVDDAIKIVQDGGWLHIFPEGKVNQRKINPAGGLIRFKWGVSRILMDSKTLPEIIPMWISDRIKPLIEEWHRVAETQRGTVGVGGEWDREGLSASGEEQRGVRDAGRLANGKERSLRIRICDILQESVRKLGETVEREEGRFERGEWCQSTAGVDLREKS